MRFHPENLYKSTICLLICLLTGSLNGMAWTPEEKKTALTGVVVTSDGQPAPGVSVYLKELEKGTVTSTNGDFSFRNIPAGEYHLEVSMLGFEKISRVVTLTQDQATHVKIELQESSITFDEVTISGGGNRFAKK